MKMTQKTKGKAKRRDQKSRNVESLKARLRRAAELEQQIIASVPHVGNEVDELNKK